MNILSKKTVLANKTEYMKKIKHGAVFIYPTDTIYGIGCDATNESAVKKIRIIKKRYKAPFSVAAPSKKWVRTNCTLSKEAEIWLKKLPGPYTLLLRLKNKSAVAKQVVPKTDVIGIRMPKSWLANLLKKLNLPIVSTSANITKQNHMTSLKTLNKQVAKKVDFIVYEGKKESRPSTIVDLTLNEPKIINR